MAFSIFDLYSLPNVRKERVAGPYVYSKHLQDSSSSPTNSDSFLLDDSSNRALPTQSSFSHPPLPKARPSKLAPLQFQQLERETSDGGTINVVRRRGLPLSQSFSHIPRAVFPGNRKARIPAKAGRTKLECGTGYPKPRHLNSMVSNQAGSLKELRGKGHAPTISMEVPNVGLPRPPLIPRPRKILIKAAPKIKDFNRPSKLQRGQSTAGNTSGSSDAAIDQTIPGVEGDDSPMLAKIKEEIMGRIAAFVRGSPLIVRN